MPKLFIVLIFICITFTTIAQSRNGTTTHIVEKGETLYSISKKYHVTVDAVQNANKSLGTSLKIKIGQQLVIPASSGKAEDAKAEKPVTPVAKETKPVKPQSKQEIASTNPDASTHIVEKGETVYGISKANGLTVKQLRDANHLTEDMKLKLGQKLIIPSKNQEAMYKPEPKEPVSEPKPTPKQEKVVPTTEQGKDYLRAEPAPVTKKEPVKQEMVQATKPVEPKPEQTIVKAEKPQQPAQDENPFLGKPTEPAKSTPSEAAKPTAANPLKNENIDPNDYSTVFSQYNSSGKKKVIYRGIGMFMQNDNPGNQFLALYNYADMGSIVKVTNLMSKETIYVKVIGKVPASDNEKDVILKVSSEAANKLKVNEDKFLLEVTGFNVQ